MTAAAEPAAARAGLVDRLATLLHERYVDAALGAAMAAALRHALAGGRLPEAGDGPALAAALTACVQAVAADAHLRMRWFDQPLPEPAPAPDAAGLATLQRQAAEADHHGIHRVERLDGGVGLLDLREFHPPAAAAPAVEAAMTLLAPSTALLVDLRRCRGGEPETVALLAGYLLGPDPVHFNSLVVRGEPAPRAFLTRPAPAHRRFDARPLLLLTSRDTFSAAEEFAFGLQALRRATVVGETTRGGAHAGDIHRLDDHFAVFVPDARALNPLTGTNWEGRGVQPDIACPAAEALDRAHRLALQQAQAAGALPAD